MVMETNSLGIIVIGLLLAANLVIVVLLLRRRSNKNDETSTLLIKQDINSLSDNIQKLKDGLSSQITDRLDRNNEMMQKSIMGQFKEDRKSVV